MTTAFHTAANKPRPSVGYGPTPTLPENSGFQLVRLADGATIGGQQVAKNAKLLDDGKNLFLDRGDGRPIMLGGYTTADVHNPTEIASYLAGFKNGGFRHDEMCKIIPVDVDSDLYRQFSSSRAFRPAKVKTSDFSPPEEVTFDTSLTPYVAVPRRIATFVPDPVRDQAGSNWNVVTTSMDHLKLLIDMDLEFDVLGPAGTGLLTSTGNWASANTVLLGAGFQWGGASGVGASSDPIRNLQAMREASFQRITKFFMNERVGNWFLKHPEVRDHLRSRLGDGAPAAAMNKLASADSDSDVDYDIPGIGKFGICVSRAESGSDSTDYIMPDVVVGVTSPPGVPQNGNQISTCYNFRVRGTSGGTGFSVRQVRIDTRGAPGTLIIVEEKSIPTMTGSTCGGLLRAVLQ